MKKQSGQTLAATLIVIAIIGLLAVVLLTGSLTGGKSSRKDGLGTTIPGAAKLKAVDEECRNNLRQVRASLMIASTSDGESYPETLEETKLGASFYRCPIGKEPYTYEAAGGKVSCPHLGHEKY
jgi:hypothetical protein